MKVSKFSLSSIVLGIYSLLFFLLSIVTFILSNQIYWFILEVDAAIFKIDSNAVFFGSLSTHIFNQLSLFSLLLTIYDY